MQGYMIVMIVLSGMVFTFAVVFMICKTILQGYRESAARKAGWDHNGNITTPPMFDKMLDKSMLPRDDKLRQLEQRIQVLEKIVTDGHNKKRSLADEIDSLSDKA